MPSSRQALRTSPIPAGSRHWVTPPFSANTVIVDNRIGGQITGLAAFAIGAKTVNVTANAGMIEATGANSSAIVANNVTVNNVSGGTISGGESGIMAGTADVTNATGATISGGIDGINVVGSSTVTNAGTISGGTNSVKFNGTGTNTLILQTGSVLIGDAVGSTLAGATNKLILQGSGTVDNHFTGFNTLDVEASGAWVWNSNSAIDATTVNSGTLAVDNVLAGPVTVNSGGTLAGHGIISGDISVANGGTVAPGAAIPFSTLNVSGNVSFQPGSIFRVNANAAGQNDKLAITGSATLTGGTVNVLAGGSFAPSSSTPYTILTTTNVNGLGGTTFASVTTNLAFLTPSLSYTANDVTLTLATATGGTGDPGGGDPGGGGTGGGTTGRWRHGQHRLRLCQVAQTRNQRAVATALDRGPVSNPLIIAVLNQTVAGARQAFDALSGEVFGSVHNAQGQEAQFARSAMLGRMRQSSYAGIPGDLGALGFGGPALAYAAGDTSSADSASRRLRNQGRAWRTRSLARSDLLGAGSRRLGPFRQRWQRRLVEEPVRRLPLRCRCALRRDAGAPALWPAICAPISMSMRARAAPASTACSSAATRAAASARSMCAAAALIRSTASIPAAPLSSPASPTRRVRASTAMSDRCSAKSATAWPSAVSRWSRSPGWLTCTCAMVRSSRAAALRRCRVQAPMRTPAIPSLACALRPSCRWPTARCLIPRGMLQWQHAFGDVTPATALAFQGTGAAFSVAGIPIARDTALVEGGFDWRFAPQAKLGAFYQGELAAHAQTHAVKGAFTWDF